MVMPAATVATLTDTTLVHSCQIARRSLALGDDDAQAFDAYGEAETTAYAPVLPRVACFARQRPGQGDIAEPGRALVAAGWQVRLPKGTAVSTDDQISAVEDAAGVSIVDGPLTVTEVICRAGHVLAITGMASLAGPVAVEEAP